MATSSKAPDDSLEGHLSILLDLVGCLQALEDELLASEGSDGGFESNEENGGRRWVNAELATSTQPVGGTGMFFLNTKTLQGCFDSRYSKLEIVF